MLGEHRFLFSFTQWSGRNGSPYGVLAMNKLLTTIEITMLELDPYVTVRSRYAELVSKSKLF